jgi:hypothetical protein
MLRIGVSYLIGIPCTESHCFTNGREASFFSWSTHWPFSPSCRTSWFTVVDVWDWSPLAMDKVSHGLGGKEVEMPSPSRTISIVGPERPLWFCLSSINSEVLNRSSCSLGLRQVSIESHPFSPLILKLALLRCL